MPTKSLEEIAAKESRFEITDYTVYGKLSRTERQPKLKRVFSELAAMEYGHYEFWSKYCKNKEIRPDALKIHLVLLMRRVLGGSFIIKYLEGSEAATIKKYGSMKHIIPKPDRRSFDSMLEDEKGHEQAFAMQIQGTYVLYISFIVLGLADALVEIAGIHAGSLGIYASTFLTGLAGIVAGAAASISMASAAFVQAKQGFSGSAKVAAAYTGVSYFISAVLMATPYFLTSSMIVAITSSLILGMLLIAFISWYDSVISGSSFKKDFSELAGIMLAATVALFLFGLVIRHALGITI